MTRIALAATGDPLAAGTWSGTPVGVARGLRAHGAVGVGRRRDAAARRARGGGGGGGACGGARGSTRGTRRSCSGCARRWSARRLAPVDGVVLMGAEFGLPAGTRYVTLSDLTLVQARATHPVFSRLSDARVRGLRPRGSGRCTRRRSACCTASHWTAASLREDYGVPAEKVHVVGLGPNHEPAAGSATPATAPRFLFVGREWERKHGPLLAARLRAAARRRSRTRGSTWSGNTRR